MGSPRGPPNYQGGLAAAKNVLAMLGVGERKKGQMMKIQKESLNHTLLGVRGRVMPRVRARMEKVGVLPTLIVGSHDWIL